MPTYQLTTVFNQGKSGWSETWYCQASNHEQALTKLRNVLPLRQGLLGGGASIEYVRVSDVAIKGDSQVQQLTNWSVSTSPTGADEPWDGVYVRAEAGPLYRRQMFLRGIPDTWAGPAGAFPGAPPLNASLTDAVQRWKASAINQGFQLRCTDKEGAGATKTPIDSIAADAQGRVSFSIAANMGAVNDRFIVSDYDGPDAKLLNGRWKILAKVGNIYSIKLRHAVLTNSAENTGGQGRPEVIVYKNLEEVIIIRMAKRSTGRAFFLPVGRRPA
jgi:hypothetical protein